MNPKIFVVGSSNIDQFSYASNMPKDGETVFGESYETGFGGKGANQAVMIGLLGSDAYIITCLGDDLFADATLENYKNHLVNVDFVFAQIPHHFHHRAFVVYPHLQQQCLVDHRMFGSKRV